MGCKSVRSCIAPNCIPLIRNRLEELSSRFEVPNPRNRWDRPLFTLGKDDPTPSKQILEALEDTNSTPARNIATEMVLQFFIHPTVAEQTGRTQFLVRIGSNYTSYCDCYLAGSNNIRNGRKRGCSKCNSKGFVEAQRIYGRIVQIAAAVYQIGFSETHAKATDYGFKLTL